MIREQSTGSSFSPADHLSRSPWHTAPPSTHPQRARPLRGGCYVLCTLQPFSCSSTPRCPSRAVAKTPLNHAPSILEIPRFPFVRPIGTCPPLQPAHGQIVPRLSSEDSRRENCLIVYLGILADTYRRRFKWIEAHKGDRLRYLPCLTTPSWCHHRHLHRR